MKSYPTWSLHFDDEHIEENEYQAVVLKKLKNQSQTR